MISFHQFINLKEALSLDDPLAQSTLKIKNKYSNLIIFEFKLDEDYYIVKISNAPEEIYLQDGKTLDELNIKVILLKVNNSFQLTNKLGMQANIVYNMLLNAIKQAHDHFGENNIYGYIFGGMNSNQNIMYYRLMKRFAPNLITWSGGVYLKPETIQKLKDQNPNIIDKIDDHINQETSERLQYIKDAKQIKNRRRLRRITP